MSQAVFRNKLKTFSNT